MDFADDFVVDDPLTFYYFLEGGFAVNIFRFGSHFWIFLFHQVRCAWNILVVFVSSSLACLNYLEIISFSSVCLNSSGMIRIHFSCELDWLEFSVLIFFLNLALSCCACFRFYFISFWIPYLFVSRGPRAVSFLVFFGMIRFVGTWSFLQGPWCRIFVFFRFINCILMCSRTKSYGWLTG